MFLSLWFVETVSPAVCSVYIIVNTQKYVIILNYICLEGNNETMKPVWLTNQTTKCKEGPAPSKNYVFGTRLFRKLWLIGVLPQALLAVCYASPGLIGATGPLKHICSVCASFQHFKAEIGQML